MEIAFPWPMTEGEWVAWAGAAATVLLGLAFMFAPRLSLRAIGLQPPPELPQALAGSRATVAGFHLGLGLACLLMAQPLLYIALGFSWGFTAFGRIVSMLSDRGNTLHNWTWLVAELVLAALPLAFAFGFVP